MCPRAQDYSPIHATGPTCVIAGFCLSVLGCMPFSAANAKVYFDCIFPFDNMADCHDRLASPVSETNTAMGPTRREANQSPVPARPRAKTELSRHKLKRPADFRFLGISVALRAQQVVSALLAAGAITVNHTILGVDSQCRGARQTVRFGIDGINRTDASGRRLTLLMSQRIEAGFNRPASDFTRCIVHFTGETMRRFECRLNPQRSSQSLSAETLVENFRNTYIKMFGTPDKARRNSLEWRCAGETDATSAKRTCALSLRYTVQTGNTMEVSFAHFKGVLKFDRTWSPANRSLADGIAAEKNHLCGR